MKISIMNIVLLTALLVSPAAWAHDHREVGGKFMFMVGFVKEPAFAGEMNGVDLHVTTLKDQQPVEGLGKTLKVTVLKEDQKKSVTLPLRPMYQEPGRYAGYFLPTQPGTYVFIFEGTINGVAVHERFESGKDKFHNVEDVVSLRFP